MKCSFDFICFNAMLVRPKIAAGFFCALNGFYASANNGARLQHQSPLQRQFQLQLQRPIAISAAVAVDVASLLFLCCSQSCVRASIARGS